MRHTKKEKFAVKKSIKSKAIATVLSAVTVLSAGSVTSAGAAVMQPLKVVELSKLTEDYTAQNGDILTGKLADGLRLNVQYNASVILRDVVAGELSCGDNATLILEGASQLCGESGIFGYGALTIDGDGMLNVRARGSHAGIYTKGTLTIEDGIVTAYGGTHAAGIGCDYQWDENVICGDIVINGGVVTAVGGSGAAGIGSGESTGMMREWPLINSCGNITVNGGVVTATGGDGGAGIGTGREGSVGIVMQGKKVVSTKGSITINDGFVTATGGSDAAGIGTGDYPSCGIGWVYNNICYYDCATLTVCGGIVSAVAGSNAAAIGMGAHGHIDSISVTNGVKQVKVSKQSESADYIGECGNSFCYNITIDDDANIVKI